MLKIKSHYSFNCHSTVNNAWTYCLQTPPMRCIFNSGRLDWMLWIKLIFSICTSKNDAVCVQPAKRKYLHPHTVIILALCIPILSENVSSGLQHFVIDYWTVLVYPISSQILIDSLAIHFLLRRSHGWENRDNCLPLLTRPWDRSSYLAGLLNWRSLWRESTTPSLLLTPLNLSTPNVRIVIKNLCCHLVVSAAELGLNAHVSYCH